MSHGMISYRGRLSHLLYPPWLHRKMWVTLMRSSPARSQSWHHLKKHVSSMTVTRHCLKTSTTWLTGADCSCDQVEQILSAAASFWCWLLTGHDATRVIHARYCRALCHNGILSIIPQRNSSMMPEHVAAWDLMYDVGVASFQCVMSRCHHGHRARRGSCWHQLANWEDNPQSGTMNLESRLWSSSHLAAAAAAAANILLVWNGDLSSVVWGIWAVATSETIVIEYGMK